MQIKFATLALGLCLKFAIYTILFYPRFDLDRLDCSCKFEMATTGTMICKYYNKQVNNTVVCNTDACTPLVLLGSN